MSAGHAPRGAAGKGSPPGAPAIKVLLIEDDRVDEMATLRAVAALALPYDIEVARSLAQARHALQQRRFDVILADYKLADGNSFDLMDAFAEQLVIFVTGAWDEADAARALRLGVHDYLIKDVDGKYLNLLNYRVQSAIRQRDLAQRLRDSEARLQAILDHAPALITARDAAGRLILSNRHHDEHAGIGTAAPRGGVASAASAAPAAHLECEEVLTHRDGSEHTYLTVRFPMPEAQGRAHAIGAISVDITARKQAEQQVRSLAFQDPLTGLPNRRLLLDRLQQALASSSRHASHGAVYFIDLDHFKAINDTLGHDQGDLLLQEVARRLLDCVRGEDTVARIGGDEFVVVAVGLARFESAAADQAAVVGEKIVAAIGRPGLLQAHAHIVTPSIGVTLFKGPEAAPEAVLKRADVALYRAKSAGRGRLCFSDAAMQLAFETRAELDEDLRAGAGRARDQFCLHYQARVDAGDGTVGAEAMLRWQHPRHGLLMPERFVPLAEHNRSMVPIGQWVVDSACAQIRRWAGHPRWGRLQLAVNVSARQFSDDDFVSRVEVALRSHAADPSRLRLELREEAVREPAAKVLQRLKALRSLGVGLTMDDFGISPAALSQLKRLPLDQIKISQALMPRLVDEAHDAAVVKTIVGIADGLGVSVVAAGVESEAQRVRLLELGCTRWQGPLFGQPAPLAEFESIAATLPPPCLHHAVSAAV